MAEVQNLGPLDWRIGIVDKQGRPTPEFQRRWNTQRGNNDLIGSITTGSGAPTGIPTEGQVYIDISSTPWTFYAGHDSAWGTVGVVNFVDLADVPHDYTSAANKLVRVTPGEDGLEFDSLSDVIDDLGSDQGDILFRGALDWEVLAPSTAGFVLSTNGASADPTWIAQSGGGGSAKLVDGNPVALPGLGSLTWLNQGGATAVAHTNGPISLTIPAQNADQLRGLYQTPPATPWTLTCKISPSLWPVNFYTGGVFITDGTRLVTLNIGYAGPSIQVVQWNSVTSFSSSPFGKTSVQLQIMWLRIYHDGTTLHFSISQNGADWLQLYTQSAGTWLGTITGAGVYGDNNDTTGLGFPSIIPIWSFELIAGTGTDSTW